MAFKQKKELKLTKDPRVFLIGRCGNQLFGLACALFLSKELNQTIEISSQTLEGDAFEVKNLDLPERVKYGQDNRFSVLISKLVQKGFYPGLHRDRKSDIYDSVLRGRISVKRSSFIGYFQDYRIPNSVKSDLLDIFLARKNQIRTALKILNLDFDESIAIHIRGGDFLQNRDIYLTIGPEYYEHCVSVIKALNPEKQITLYIFTDDKVHAKNIIAQCNFQQTAVIFLDDLLKFGALDSILCMSLFKNLITSNSTFSWWGAFLNDRGERRIFQPKKWFEDGIKPRNALLVEHWEQI